MGMFSTVIHDGKEFQFKTGCDDCVTYKVGDKIDWTPDAFWPGSHIDGVHSACHDIDKPDWWVIVKGCVIVAVEPPADLDDYKRLYEKYGITEPDPKLWTKAQWRAKAKREAKYKADYAAYCEKLGVKGPAAVFSWYIHCKLRETSVIDKILPARKVE
jgi:hypothetical protein